MNPLVFIGLGVGALALLALTSSSASAAPPAPPLGGGGSAPPPLGGGGSRPTPPPPPAAPAAAPPLGGGGRRAPGGPRISPEQLAAARARGGKAQRLAESQARTQAAQAAYLAARGGAPAPAPAPAAAAGPGTFVRVPILLSGVSTAAREGLKALNPAQFGLAAPVAIPMVGQVYTWTVPSNLASQAGAAELGSKIAALWGGSVVSTKDIPLPGGAKGIGIALQ